MANENQIGIYELLANKDIEVNDVIRKTDINNLYLIPSTIKYFDIQNKLSTELNPYNILKKKLSSIKNNFDYIIIDNHPSLSTMSLNGLVASDEVLVPLTPDNFALEGYNNTDISGAWRWNKKYIKRNKGLFRARTFNTIA